MPKIAYLYDEITGAFIEDFLVEERPEFTYPDMDKGPEFDGITMPETADDERARWDGTRYIVEQKYNTLRNATYVKGEPGQVWNGESWS